MPGFATQGDVSTCLRVEDPGTSMTAFDPVAEPVDRLLDHFLADRVRELADLDDALQGVGQQVAALVAAGGKRLRPAFAYWGHRATGADHDPGVWHPAGAVELLHTFALIHDDVMDRSSERRGRPAVHAGLAAAHVAEGLVGDADWFGVGGAILAGDLAFVWADQLFDDAPLPVADLARARRVFTQLRVEVMAGQYLDLRLAGARSAVEADARRVALLKSGRYTVTRPLQMGAALAGGNEKLSGVLADYGDAVGMAFQLRDDVLGVFGDPRDTGKDVEGDLREGKRTVLLLTAYGLVDAATRAELDRLIGHAELDPDGAERARALIADSGALGAVEKLIRANRDAAIEVTGNFPQPARAALVELAELAADRSA